MKNSNEKDNGAIFRLGFFRIVNRLVSGRHRFNVYFEPFTLCPHLKWPLEKSLRLLWSHFLTYCNEQS